MTGRIVHISDLHFEKRAKAAADPLLDAIRRARPSYIVCTGDLVTQPFEKNILDAKAWLEKLREECGVSKEKFLVVPGNHDYGFCALVKSNYPMHRDKNGRGYHPLLMVAAEGGGIRAGYWTALVLSTLENASKPSRRFSDHLFAISGVSGGSLGAATFDVLIEENQPNPPASQVREILGKEFLAPLVGKMFYPDLIQRFLFFPIPLLDRARALEEGWEATDPHVAEGFTRFFKATTWMPDLFLNGTEQETGARIVTSTLEFENGEGGGFADAVDGVKMMEGKEMRLSTAVHARARFTYFSPARRYPDGNHVADGGYYDNSGAETVSDVLRALRAKNWPDVQPIVIAIRNGPERPPPSPAEAAKATIALRRQHNDHEVTAPLDTMLIICSAHADDALAQLRSTLPEGMFLSFTLVERGTVLPLGWTLSPQAMAEMDFQVDPQAAGNLATWNTCSHELQAQLLNSGTKENLLDMIPEKPAQ